MQWQSNNIQWRIQNLTLGGVGFDNKGIRKSLKVLTVEVIFNIFCNISIKTRLNNESWAKWGKKKLRKFGVLDIKNHTSAAVWGRDVRRVRR